MITKSDDRTAGAVRLWLQTEFDFIQSYYHCKTLSLIFVGASHVVRVLITFKLSCCSSVRLCIRCFTKSGNEKRRGERRERAKEVPFYHTPCNFLSWFTWITIHLTFPSIWYVRLSVAADRCCQTVGSAMLAIFEEAFRCPCDRWLSFSVRNDEWFFTRR